MYQGANVVQFRSDMIILLSLVIVASLAHSAAAAAGPNAGNEALHGIWAGSPKEGQTVFFVISGRTDGSLKASFGHIDPWNLLSGAWMQSVSLENRALKITSNGDWVTFDGTLEPGGTAIAGNIALSGRRDLACDAQKDRQDARPPAAADSSWSVSVRTAGSALCQQGGRYRVGRNTDTARQRRAHSRQYCSFQEAAPMTGMKKRCFTGRLRCTRITSQDVG